MHGNEDGRDVIALHACKAIFGIYRRSHLEVKRFVTMCVVIVVFFFLPSDTRTHIDPCMFKSFGYSCKKNLLMCDSVYVARGTVMLITTCTCMLYCSCEEPGRRPSGHSGSCDVVLD